MRHVYQLAGLVAILFGAFVVWQSHGMVLYTDMGPGPGFFPFWLGLVFILLSAIWLGQVTLQAQPPIEVGFFPDRAASVRILSIVGALAFFVVIADVIGFQLSMFLFLFFLFIALGRQNFWLTLVLSVVGSFGVYYVFYQLLQVELPKPSVEFLANLGL